MVPNNWMQQRTDLVVCHYTSSKTAMENIFSTGQLRLCKLQQTNDPFEKEFWEPVVHGSSPEVFENAHVYGVSSTFRKVKQKLFVFCCAMDATDSNPSVSTGVSGKSFADPSLWAHYGENHKGVCLALDREKLVTCIRKNVTHEWLDSSEIHYDLSDTDAKSIFTFSVGNKKFGPLDAIINKHIRDNIKPILFKKQVCWQNEREFRIAISSNKGQEDTIFPLQSCLMSIIIGDDFLPCYLPTIQAYADRFKVSLAQIHWMHGKPFIEMLTDGV
jgi:hypothetical protein